LLLSVFAFRRFPRYIFVIMAKSRATPAIRLRGVRHNNLKNFDLDLPIGKMIVITGLSGSGKSSLAFDTLFAEGQRRYIETFSPYARQFFDRMDKPQVDRIEGIPPAIAIEQRNAVRTTRSTVGTMTEICDYMKLLWPHVAQLFCRQCGQIVRRDTTEVILECLARLAPKFGAEILVTFDVPLSEKLSLGESLQLIRGQGYQRLLLDKRAVRIEEAMEALGGKTPLSLTVIQDRLKIGNGQRARLAEACEHAYHFGKGRLRIFWAEAAGGEVGHCEYYSSGYHCARCDIEYREPIPPLFSFNHPIGACPACRGFGRVITIDYNLALPDKSKTLVEGVVKPWQTGTGLESQHDLMRACRALKVPTNVPFRELSPEHQQLVIDGDPDYGKDEEHEWPRAWYGVKGYFRWLESKAYKMHVRVLLSRYRAYSRCPDCNGQRFQPESLLFKVTDARGNRLTLSDFYQLSLESALAFIDSVATLGGRARRPRRAAPDAQPSNDPLKLALNEVRARLEYLVDVGLGYLTLDRPTRSLSGGETERVNLTTCLGSRLVNTLYVLDEPSVGLHPRDTDKLVRIVHGLRDLGNTLVVVEHEARVMRAADQIVDLGPGHGESGGHVVFQGTYDDLLKVGRGVSAKPQSSTSLTAQYLSGAREISIPKWRRVDSSTPRLKLRGANLHNLKNLTVEIPLNRFVCLTGVSGSGKTTLAREVVFPRLEAALKSGQCPPAADEVKEDAADLREVATSNGEIIGAEDLSYVVLVDQSALGRTPRSNPAVYTGAFDDIRELFAQSDAARQRGLNASAFSFNSAVGQCERCRGAGFEKIEMQFLSDVFIRCPECNGRRYRPHILEVKLSGTAGSNVTPGSRSNAVFLEWSVADFLDATVDEAIGFLLGYIRQPPARRALQALTLLQEAGLGYLRLGQPINTLSGGEAQRLKLVSHLADFTRAKKNEENKPTLFILDEPTTGLHFDDVSVLLNVLQRLVNAGHSLLVIEHNLDVIKCADWVIDLGPEAGDKGGEVVVEGTPARIAACAESHTGRALGEVLQPARSMAN
jgi:excinuclease ABC subunit A